MMFTRKGLGKMGLRCVDYKKGHGTTFPPSQPRVLKQGTSVLIGRPTATQKKKVRPQASDVNAVLRADLCKCRSLLRGPSLQLDVAQAA